MTAAGSNLPPLRPIHRVDLDSGHPNDKIEIFVEDHGRPDYVASVLDGDFAETFRRLQHTCIKTFLVGIRDSPFLRYWKAQKTARFAVVTIRLRGFDCGSPTDYKETPDYDVLDSIVNHLRPRTTEHVVVDDSSWRENGRNSKYLKVLARDSFLNNLQVCRLRVQGNTFPPSAFFLNEPGYRKYEIDAQYLGSKADGIDSFIESFVRDGCANKKLESVHITWYESSRHPSPVLKQLGKPTKTELPLSELDLTAEITRDVHKRSQCEMYSFVNTKQRKRLEVYKWRAEDMYFFCLRHKTHVLHCRVKNL